MFAHILQRPHLKVQGMATCRSRVCPHTDLLVTIVKEPLTSLISVFRPCLQLFNGVSLRLVALPFQPVYLPNLILLGNVSTSEVHDGFVRIPVQLLQRMCPGARVGLHVVIEDSIRTVVVLRPFGGQWSG
eukprot:Skav229340  [mRNA]  locus=scaffold2596:165210:172783:+ [translate_table: standard]